MAAADPLDDVDGDACSDGDGDRAGGEQISCTRSALAAAGARMLLAHSLSDGVANPDWKAIAEQAAQANPPCSSWISDLCKFVEMSPQNGEILYDIDNALKTFTNVEVTGQTLVLGSDFWKKINALKFGKGKVDAAYPYVVASFIKANYAGDSIVDGMCKTRYQPVGASLR